MRNLLSPTRIAAWVYILAGALLIWNAWAVLSSSAISFAGIAISWLLSWAICNWILFRHIRRMEFPKILVVAGMIGLVTLMALDAKRYGNSFAKRQGINVALARLPDKVRLETYPSIAPSVVVSSQPQTFYVHAHDADDVSIKFANENAVEAQALGYGFFRVNYDPRIHGAPSESVIIDVDGETVERSLRLVEQLAHPRWIRADPETGLAVVVSEETDELYVISRSGESQRISVGDGPTDALLLDNDLLIVSHRFEPDLWFVNVADGQVVDKVRVGYGQLAMAASPDADAIVVSTNNSSKSIALVNTAERVVQAVASIENYADWLSFDGSGEYIIYTDRMQRSLNRLDRVDGEMVATVEPLKLGRPVVAMTRAPRDNTVFVAVTGYDPSGFGPVGNHFVEDQLLEVDTAAWTVRSQQMTARSSDKQRRPAEVRYGGSPMGLSYDNDGDLLVTFAGTDDVWRYSDTAPPQRLLGRDTIQGLWAPHGVADLGGGVIAVSSPSQGAVGLFDSEMQPVARFQLAPDDSELRGDALAARRGERSFYETARRGLSCQSCHTYGETDHALHNIAGAEFTGETRRQPTLTLRGIADTAPFLRDASYHTVGSLLSVAENRYDGYVRSDSRRSGDWDHYTETLILRPNPRSLEGRDLEKEQRGLDVFIDAMCHECHTPPAFTNLSQHLPSSLFPVYGEHSEEDEVLDTPSLFGLRDKYPFLQDGRARTLGSVFTEHNPANLHGRTEHLSEQEIDLLVYFLEGL